MTKQQVIEIRDVFNDIQKGISNPIAINKVYKYIQVIQGMEVAQQVKIRTISRYCMLNYYELEQQINAIEPEPSTHEYQEFNESIGTVENKPQHSHSETVSHDEAHDDIGTFLTKKEKEKLAQSKSGTTLEVKKARGNPNFGKKG